MKWSTSLNPVKDRRMTAIPDEAVLRAKFSDDGKWIKFEDSTSWEPYLSPDRIRELGAAQ